jgi:hypothetical protein
MPRPVEPDRHGRLFKSWAMRYDEIYDAESVSGVTLEYHQRSCMIMDYLSRPVTHHIYQLAAPVDFTISAMC